MDVDNQEDLSTMEAESAAQSIQNDGKTLVENEARNTESEGELQTEASKQQEVFVGTLTCACPVFLFTNTMSKFQSLLVCVCVEPYLCACVANHS